MYYLHGALHLFDDGENVIKLRSSLGDPLIDQLGRQLDDGNYPLFVSEGTSRQKITRIRTNPYLLDAYEALTANDMELVVYGFKLGEMDEHIMTAIGRSRVPAIGVVLHSAAPDDEKDAIRARVTRLAQSIPTCGHIHFAESNETNVWD